MISLLFQWLYAQLMHGFLTIIDTLSLVDKIIFYYSMLCLLVHRIMAFNYLMSMRYTPLKTLFSGVILICH